MSDPGKPGKRMMARLDSSPETKKDRRLSWIEENKDLHLPGPLVPGHVDQTGHVGQPGHVDRTGHVDQTGRVSRSSHVSHVDRPRRSGHVDQPYRFERVSSEMVVTCMLGWRQAPADGRPNILVLDHTGPTCLHALMVMSLGDLLVSKIAVHLDDFVDIVALSRVCRASRRALSMKHPDFAAFRAALEPFGRSYSPEEWKRRASEAIAKNCAFALFKFLGARLHATDRPPYATAVMHLVLSSRVGVSLTDDTRERTLAFCENAFRWSWDMLKYCPWNKSANRRQAAVVVANPDLAPELFKRLVGKDRVKGRNTRRTESEYFCIFSAVKAAIYAGVPLPVFRAFVESAYDQTTPELAINTANRVQMLSRTIFSPNPEILVYAIDWVSRMRPRDVHIFVNRLVSRKKIRGNEERIEHFVCPAALDILKARGLVDLKHERDGLRLVVLYHHLYEEVQNITDSSTRIKQCLAEIEWYETNIGAKKN